MSEEFVNIAEELTEMYELRRQTKVTLTSIVDSLERKKLELTPPEGWVGKNQNERDLMRDKNFMANQDFINLFGALQLKRMEMDEVETLIQRQETVRRGREYELMALYLEARFGKRLAPASAMEEAVVEDILQEEPDPEPEPAELDIYGADIPF